MSTKPKFKDGSRDYNIHQLTDADSAVISKIIALYDRTQHDDPNDPTFGQYAEEGQSSAELSRENKESIAAATREFLASCRDIAITQRIGEYKKEKDILMRDGSDGKLKQAKTEEERLALRAQMRQDLSQAETDDVRTQIREDYNGREPEYKREVKWIHYDKTDDLNKRSIEAIEKYVNALNDSHAFDGMIIGAEGEKDVPGIEPMSRDEFKKNAYTDGATLFGQSAKPEQGQSPRAAYDIVLGIAKAMAETDMRSLKREINSKDGRSQAIQMLFEREASRTFTQSAHDLQHISRGQAEPSY